MTVDASFEIETTNLFIKTNIQNTRDQSRMLPINKIYKLQIKKYILIVYDSTQSFTHKQANYWLM